MQGIMGSWGLHVPATMPMELSCSRSARDTFQWECLQVQSDAAVSSGPRRLDLLSPHGGVGSLLSFPS
jgi:hypothetical protein